MQDNTIIATAIPRITDEFGALEDIGWYESAYLLTTCAVQLLFGKLYTFYTVKWVFLGALAVFEIGSAVSGAAPSSVALIVGRAVAGIGAAGLFSGALLIIAHSVPLNRRPAYMSVVGSMYGVASVTGPLLGGAFTDHVTWRWCFYINLPLGAVTAVLVLFFMRVPKTATLLKRVYIHQQIMSIDVEGTVLFIPGIISLPLALQWGGIKDEWKSGRIIGLFVTSGVLMAGFVAVQIWKQDRAMVPPRIFLNRTVWSAGLYGTAIGGSFFLMVYYVSMSIYCSIVDVIVLICQPTNMGMMQLPLWFQAVQGASAVESGIKNIPMILSVILSSLVSGAAVTSFGYYTPFIIASSILAAVGAAMELWQRRPRPSSSSMSCEIINFFYKLVDSFVISKYMRTSGWGCCYGEHSVGERTKE